MSNNADIMQGTLPLVRNASKVYLKLLNLKIGEFADVLKSEIPPSYQTAKRLATAITKRYGFLFVVRKLQHQNGWRVMRVENLEMQKQFSNFRTKLQTMENKPATRNHNFSDADLAQVVDQKISLATRDSADLIPRGVTAVRLAALQTANDAFKIMPSDEELEGDVGIAVQAKNEKRALLESRIGNVRTMAQNVFGEDSAEYRGFGFLGMVSLADNELSRISKVVYKRAVKFQAQLLAEGCTPAFLTAMDGEVQLFDAKLDEVNTAEKDRLEGTGKRIAAGNQIYTETEKICNTAKDVYRETDPIKHDEYLMYPTVSGNKELQREGDLNMGQITDIEQNDNIHPTAQTQVFLEATNAPMRYYASNVPQGPQTGGAIDVQAGQSNAYTISDFVTAIGLNDTNNYVNVQNTGVATGHYKMRLTHLE